MPDVKPWKCVNGHTMGRVIVVKRGGNKTRQLELYRFASPDEKTKSYPDESEVMGLIDGMTDVRCSICGEIQTWLPDVGTVQRLLQHAGVDKKMIRLVIKALREEEKSDQ